jgi:hypothetical protein
MLFNSDAFLFVFLPVVLAGFFACGAVARGACVAWLVAASFAFYAWWNVAHLWVPAVSLAFNFAVATAIDRGRERPRRARLLLAFGIAANVLLLFNFKALISPWFGASGEEGRLQHVARHRHPAGHLVHHLPADRLPRRYLSRARRRPAAGRVRVLPDVLPAARDGADPPLPRHRPAALGPGLRAR